MSAPPAPSAEAGSSGTHGAVGGSAQPELPDRPALPGWAPVLQRGPDSVQIGLDSGTGVVLAGVPPETARLLGLLDGTRSLPALRREVSAAGLDGRWLDRVLHLLTEAGLLQGPRAAQSIDPSTVQVRLIGAGRLGRCTARAMLAAGIGRIHLNDPDPVDPELYPQPGAGSTQADALRSSLHAEAGRTRQLLRTDLRVIEHWSQPDQSSPAATVIASEYAEPDRVPGEEFVRAGHPHLYLRPWRGGVVLGPLVRPGRGPCLACLDQRRRDADPGWPQLLGQLCRIRIPTEPLTADWAATNAVSQLLAELSGRPSALTTGTMELTPTDWTVNYRQWPMHPRCGCAWH